MKNEQVALVGLFQLAEHTLSAPEICQGWAYCYYDHDQETMDLATAETV